MPGHGRPFVDDPRCFNLNLRVTKAEKERLEAYAKEHNLTQSQVLKKLLDPVIGYKSSADV